MDFSSLPILEAAPVLVAKHGMPESASPCGSQGTWLSDSAA